MLPPLALGPSLMQGSTSDTFKPHVDAGWGPSYLADDGESIISVEGDDLAGSRFSLLLYLNGGFEGGETTFFPSASSSVSSDAVKVKPEAGSVLLFPQALGDAMMDWATSSDELEGQVKPPLHEGSVVQEGTKWVIRSDVIYRHDETVPDKRKKEEDRLTMHDQAVRETMKPYRGGTTTPVGVYSEAFLSTVDELYEPVMGAENLGYLLHSFVRFAKPRRVVEIGAGYTTLFVLAAMKENDEEMSRIAERRDEMRLLDYPWVVGRELDEWETGRSKLVVVDNCRHQKQTATRAEVVAEELGLGEHLDFKVGDAFEQTFEEDSVDLLFCDFGVGAAQRVAKRRAEKVHSRDIGFSHRHLYEYACKERSDDELS